MAGMTSFLQKKVLDDFLSIASYTVPTTVYVSLHTASPGESGSHAAEIALAGYARKSITGSMSAADATSGISTNTATITFGPAGADWGIIGWLGVEDALTVGNMCFYGATTTAKTILNGASFVLIIGQLSLQFA